MINSSKIFLVLSVSFVTLSAGAQSKKVNTPYKPLLVCNLSTEEQIQRGEELQETVFKKISKVVERKDGMELVFNEPLDYSLELAEFINFERKCCPGITFTMTFDPNEGPIRLKIGNSREIKEMVKMLLKQ